MFWLSPVDIALLIDQACRHRSAASAEKSNAGPSIAILVNG
jgi:hypothetical protein